MFKSLFKHNFFRVITGKTTYIAIFLIMLGGVVTFKRNSILFNLDKIHPVGGLNRFIFSCIIDNSLMSVIAPLMAMLVYPTIIFEDIRTHYIRHLYIKIPCKSITVFQVIQSFVLTGGVYAFANMMMLLICVAVDTNPSAMVTFVNGPFSSVYYVSMTLYSFVFIMHSFLVGGAFGILGIGIALNVRNKCMMWILPVLLYYLGLDVLALFPEKIQEILIYIIPLLTYEITTLDLSGLANISQLFFVIVAGIILIYWGQYRRQE